MLLAIIWGHIPEGKALELFALEYEWNRHGLCAFSAEGAKGIPG